MLKRLAVFKVALCYKSGNVVEHEFLSFSCNAKGCEYKLLSSKRRLVFLNWSEVESVHQLGYRYVWRWVK